MDCRVCGNDENTHARYETTFDGENYNTTVYYIHEECEASDEA